MRTFLSYMFTTSCAMTSKVCLQGSQTVLIVLHILCFVLGEHTSLVCVHSHPVLSRHQNTAMEKWEQNRLKGQQEEEHTLFEIQKSFFGMILYQVHQEKCLLLTCSIFKIYHLTLTKVLNHTYCKY